MAGCFISFEGGDGSGKSTQARLLAARLKEMGLDVELTREPGGSPNAEAVRKLLLSHEHDWDMRAEALLFAAGRSDHVNKLIRPALERGAWVISDRFLDSSRAYQGAAGGLGDEHIMALHKMGAAMIPDRTLLLQVAHKTGTGRANSDGDDVEVDRIMARGDSFHAGVEDAFKEIAFNDPGRVRTINGSGTIEEVHRAIMDQLADLLRKFGVIPKIGSDTEH